MAGVKVQGIECPFIREGDNLVRIVMDSLREANVQLKDKDVLGITESVVARSYGLYITVDDIAASIDELYGKEASIVLVNPIYSRNRFAAILRGIARSAYKLTIVMPPFDEVGNPSGVNPFTGVNIKDFYEQICKVEKCECEIVEDLKEATRYTGINVLYCGLHDYRTWRLPNQEENDIVCSLYEVCADKNVDFGVLGTNKADGERLKLYPTSQLANQFCLELQSAIKAEYGVEVIVCVYGDGCFKDPVGGIWEFADPITMPGYTNPEYIESTPREVKLKFVIDEGLTDEEISELVRQHKTNRSKNKADNLFLGTTPRIYRDLLASLMDLISGSGDRKTPVVLIQNHFN